VSRAAVPVVVAVGEAVVVRLADCDDPPPEDMANAINVIRRRKPAAAPPRMTQALLGVDDVADGALAGVADMPTLAAMRFSAGVVGRLLTTGRGSGECVGGAGFGGDGVGGAGARCSASSTACPRT